MEMLRAEPFGAGLREDPGCHSPRGHPARNGGVRLDPGPGPLLPDGLRHALGRPSVGVALRGSSRLAPLLVRLGPRRLGNAGLLRRQSRAGRLGPARGPSRPGAEEDVARKLLASLDARQRAAAVISETAPANILFGPSGKSVPDPAGLLAAQMSEAQRKMLMELVGALYGQPRRGRRARADREDRRRPESSRSASRGPAAPRAGEGHYYRVQGPTFVIEYDNTQNDANHVHSVFPGPPERLRRRPPARALRAKPRSGRHRRRGRRSGRARSLNRGRRRP